MMPGMNFRWAVGLGVAMAALAGSAGAQVFPGFVTGSPFTATRVSTTTTATGEQTSFVTVARSSYGSCYMGSVNHDGTPGNIVIWDVTRHRGIQLYPKGHIFTVFSFEMNAHALPQGYVQNYMTSEGEPGSKRTVGDWEITLVGRRSLEGLETMGYTEKKTDGQTFERWYSPVLDLNIETKGNHPAEDVKSEIRLQGIRLEEPDASLFEIPAGYVQDKRNAASAGAIEH